MGVPAAAPPAGRPSCGGAESGREKRAAGSGSAVRIQPASMPPGAAAAPRHRPRCADEGKGRRGRGAASGPCGDGGRGAGCAQTALPPPPHGAGPSGRGPPDTIGTGRRSGRTNGATATPAPLPVTAPARPAARAAASSLTPSRRLAAPGRGRPRWWWWCRRRCSLSRHPRGAGAERSGRCPSGNGSNLIPCT